jgi:hypothetical protein
VRAGTLGGFPTCFVNLNELPVEAATWPLVMVSRGPAEQKLVEYFFRHQPQLDSYWPQLVQLHAKLVLEEIRMRTDTVLKEAGFKDAQEFITLLSQALGGKDRVIRALGEERVLQTLIQQFGAEQVQQMLHRLAKQASPTTKPSKRKQAPGRD